MRGLILAVMLALPVAVAGQGLGDAASRERQKRQAQPAKPVRAITQEQLDAAAAGRDAWTSPDGAFRIAFPGQPEVKDDSARGTGITYRVAAGTSTFQVTVHRPLASQNDSALMDGIRDTALRSLNQASLISENAVTTPRGVPGRQFLIGFSTRNTGRQGVMRSRAYASGGRTYVVITMAEPGGENSADVVAFLDSFEVLK